MYILCLNIPILIQYSPAHCTSCGGINLKQLSPQIRGTKKPLPQPLSGANSFRFPPVAAKIHKARYHHPNPPTAPGRDLQDFQQPPLHIVREPRIWLEAMTSRSALSTFLDSSQSSVRSSPSSVSGSLGALLESARCDAVGLVLAARILLCSHHGKPSGSYVFCFCRISCRFCSPLFGLPRVSASSPSDGSDSRWQLQIGPA